MMWANAWLVRQVQWWAIAKMIKNLRKQTLGLDKFTKQHKAHAIYYSNVSADEFMNMGEDAYTAHRGGWVV